MPELTLDTQELLKWMGPEESTNLHDSCSTWIEERPEGWCVLVDLVHRNGEHRTLGRGPFGSFEEAVAYQCYLLGEEA